MSSQGSKNYTSWFKWTWNKHVNTSPTMSYVCYCATKIFQYATKMLNLQALLLPTKKSEHSPAIGCQDDSKSSCSSHLRSLESIQAWLTFPAWRTFASLLTRQTRKARFSLHTQQEVHQSDKQGVELLLRSVQSKDEVRPAGASLLFNSGFVALNTGTGSNPHLWLDYIRLHQVTLLSIKLCWSQVGKENW